MEEQSEARILIQADWSMSYGEMAAEIERAEELPVEKPAPSKPPREKGSPEDETVVLGGDSPISFEKALGENTKDAKKEAFKYDRRDLQRAALDERERLRALFESAKPEDEEAEEGAEESADEPKGEGAKRKRRRRRRKGGADRPEGATQTTGAEAGEPQDEAQPEPPTFTPDLVASLLTPSPRPRIGAAPAAPAPVAAEPAPGKPRRTPRAKVPVTPEPAPVAVPEPVPAPMAEAAPEKAAKKKATPKPKAAPVKKAKVAEPAAEAPKPKVTRAKKTKAE